MSNFVSLDHARVSFPFQEAYRILSNGTSLEVRGLFQRSGQVLKSLRDCEGYSLLLRAAVAGNERVVKRLLSKSSTLLQRVSIDVESHVTVTEYDGSTALHWIARQGWHKQVSKVSGIFQRKLNRLGETPLYYAVRTGQESAIVQPLVMSYGTGFKKVAEELDRSCQLDPFAKAISLGKVHFFEQLMKSSRKKTRQIGIVLFELANRYYAGIGNILHVAIAFSKLESWKFLIENYGDEVRALLDRENEDGLTPLELLQEQLDDSQDKQLFLDCLNASEHSLRPQEQVDSIRVKLEGAVRENDLDKLKRIIDTDFSDGRLSLSAMYFRGIGHILHLVVACNRFSLLRYLLVHHHKELEPLIECENERGRTPLAMAVELGNAYNVILLHKKHHANLNTSDNNNLTPLHIAVQVGSAHMVEVLVGLRCKIDTIDAFGRKPDQLVEEGNPIREYLLRVHETGEHRCVIPSSFSLINALVIGGGGPKVVAAGGALHELKDHLASIERVAGTSAGALTALGLAIGVPAEEVSEILQRIDFAEILDIKNPNLVPKSELGAVINCCLDALGNSILGLFTREFDYKNSALCKGQSIEKILIEIVCKYGLNKETTFGELKFKIRKDADNKFKHLHVFACEIGEDGLQLRRFSTEDPSGDSDNILIIDAVIASMSIPFVFPPRKIRRKVDGMIRDSQAWYLDGGLLKNLPSDAFDQRRFLVSGCEGAEASTL